MPSTQRLGTGKSAEFSDAVITAGKKAATLVVSPVPGTGDFTDIQSAIDALPVEGGLVFLREGTYSISSTITLPNKDVEIRGAGRGSVVINLGANTIAAFTIGFDRAYAFSGFNITGNSSVGQIGWRITANTGVRDILISNVHSSAVIRTIDATGGAKPRVLISDCRFDLPDGTTSLLWIGDDDLANLICARVRVKSATGLGGGISGLPQVRLTDCDVDIKNGAAVSRIHASNTVFNDGTLTLGFSSLGLYDSRIVGCVFRGLATTYIEVSLVATGVISGCFFKEDNGGSSHILIYGAGVIVSGCTFFGSVTPSTSIVLSSGASQGSTIVGNAFFGIPTAVSISGGGNNIVVGNKGCHVAESGGTVDNTYESNEGFSTSVILPGTRARVNGASKFFQTAVFTPSSTFVPLFTRKNPSGLLGIGHIVNISLQTLEILEEVADFSGVLGTLITSLGPGGHKILSLQDTFLPVRPPYISYTLYIRHTGAAAVYNLHFTCHGALY